jgi:hypothetical protein
MQTIEYGTIIENQESLTLGNFKISLVSKLLDSIPIINLKRSQAIINLVIVHN